MKSPLIYQNMKYPHKFSVPWCSQTSYIQTLFLECFSISEALKTLITKSHSTSYQSTCCYTPQDDSFYRHSFNNIKSPLIYQNLKYPPKFSVPWCTQTSYIQALYVDCFSVSETLKIPNHKKKSVCILSVIWKLFYNNNSCPSYGTEHKNNLFQLWHSGTSFLLMP